jgi:3-methylcrotonyl-CoA carboxylase alpha subunit
LRGTPFIIFTPTPFIPVAAGDTLVIMEAMKMEHAIKAPGDGLVTEIFYMKGDLVDGGSDLISFEVLSPDTAS